MKKFYRFTLLLTTLLATTMAFASAPINYYDNALGKNDESLMIALRNIIRSHTQLGYNDLWNAFKSTDTDAQGYIIDMYSNCKYRPSEHGGSSSAVGGGYNREHSFPKSWFNDATPMYTDLFHLYPTDIKVNSQRSNFPFGVCANGKRLVNGQYYGKGRLGTSTYPGYSGTVFEPDDEYKGDFARTYFYMVTCYKNELPTWSGSPQLSYAYNKYKAFSTWTINMLMEWTRMDPVSEKEIKRNDAVYSIQGNRNPFIDHPELAEYIWGNMQSKPWNGSGEQVNPAILTPENGTTIDMGSTVVDTPLEYSFTLKGEGLTRGITLQMEDNEFFYVDKNSFTASEVNNGTTVVIGFTADEEGIFYNTITLTSDEVSTTFTITATAAKKGEEPPTPPTELGDSIMEDWEGCETGGYWTDIYVGNTFMWDFTDVGVWSDNLRHGELVCRLGKTSSSMISMNEDIDGGTSAIAFWAGAFGNDSDAALRVDYSTSNGATWITLGTVTTTRGSLQRFLVKADVEGKVRFRIAQTSGVRVNIDDITLYGRKQTEPSLYGDVNDDNEVNIADVNTVIDSILGSDSNPKCDVNNDSEVNIADINTIIDIILGS